MNSISVLISIALTCGVSPLAVAEGTQENEPAKNGRTSDDLYLSLLPLKILLEHQLRTPYELEHTLHEQELHKERQENLKSLPTVHSKANQERISCSEINLMKNLTEILNIDTSNKESSISREQMQKIYSSLKDCFYLKAGDAKLWGPLWHCLNRLFLFFVFH